MPSPIKPFPMPVPLYSATSPDSSGRSPMTPEVRDASWPTVWPPPAPSTRPRRAPGAVAGSSRARYAADMDDMMRSLVEAAGDVEGAVRRLRRGRVRPAHALPPFRHRPADRRSTGRLAPAQSGSSTRSCSRSGTCKLTVGQHVREISRVRHGRIGQSGVSAGALRPAAARGRRAAVRRPARPRAPRRRTPARRGSSRRCSISSTRGTPGSTTRSTSSSPTSRRRRAACATSPPSGCSARSRARRSPRADATGQRAARRRRGVPVAGPVGAARRERPRRQRPDARAAGARRAAAWASTRPRTAAAGRSADGRRTSGTRAASTRRWPGRAAWSGRPISPTPRDRSPTHLSIGPDGVTFRDPARAAVQPSVWLEAFEVAIANGEPRLRRRAPDASRRTSAATPPTTSWRPRRRGLRLRSMLAPDAGLSARLSDMLECGLLGDDLPGVREDSLPRDPRLLPQVHGRRAHAAHHPQSRVALASAEREPRAVRVDPQRSATRRSC